MKKMNKCSNVELSCHLEKTKVEENLVTFLVLAQFQGKEKKAEKSEGDMIATKYYIHILFPVLFYRVCCCIN